MTALRRIEKLLFAVAALALGAYCYFWTERVLYQWYQSENLDETLVQSREASPDNAVQRPPGWPLGRIEIPRLDLSAIIVEGVSDRSLRLGVGHIPGTALPGEPGNVGLAAHRDTFFRPLYKLRNGDVVRLTSLSGTSDFIVGSTAIVEPENTQILRADSEPSLTLVTCYPFDFIGAAPKRFVVKAQKMEAGEIPVARPAEVAAGKSPRTRKKLVKAGRVKPAEREIVKPEEPAASDDPPTSEWSMQPKGRILRALSLPIRKSLGWIRAH